MKNRLLFLGLVFPFFCLLGWLAVLTYHRQTGQNVTVAVMGYDPRDLLSGHYLRYQIDWNKTDCQQFPEGFCPKDAFCGQNSWLDACYFYIPEKNAKELENAFRTANSKSLNFEAVYSYKTGHKPISKDILINGESWHLYLENSTKLQN